MDPTDIQEASSLGLCPFRLTRTYAGHLVLRHHITQADRLRSTAAPVNSTYLELLARDWRITLAPGEGATVEVGLVRDALEEALGAVSHSLQGLESLKKRLLHYFLVASESPIDSMTAA